MSLQKVLITTRCVSREATELLSARFVVDIWDGDNDVMPSDELMKRIVGVDAVLCWTYDKIDAHVLDAAGPSLKVISTMSAGVHHIDTEECRKRGISVGHAPGVSTNSMAEFTIGLLLAASRRMFEGSKLGKCGKLLTWHPWQLDGPCLEGNTIGIIGLGRIGCAVLDRLQAFRPARVLYYDVRRLGDLDEKRKTVIFAPFEDLLQVSDFVICTCASTQESMNIFDQHAFSLMKNTAVFVNTTSGGVVDLEALYSALKDGTISAAGIDVTNPEPLPLNNPLFTLDNCIITPHIASASVPARKAMSTLAVENIISSLAGKDMPARYVAN